MPGKQRTLWQSYLKSAFHTCHLPSGYKQKMHMSWAKLSFELTEQNFGILTFLNYLSVTRDIHVKTERCVLLESPWVLGTTLRNWTVLTAKNGTSLWLPGHL